jgi:hypothetical protein
MLITRLGQTLASSVGFVWPPPGYSACPRVARHPPFGEGCQTPTVWRGEF